METISTNLVNITIQQIEKLIENNTDNTIPTIESIIGNLLLEHKNEELQNVINLLINKLLSQNNFNSVFDIIEGFVASCLSLNTINELQNIVISLMDNGLNKANYDYLFSIFCIFTKTCLFKNKIEELNTVIYALNKHVLNTNNFDYISYIINCFTQTYLFILNDNIENNRFDFILYSSIKNIFDHSISCNKIDDLNNIIIELLNNDLSKNNLDYIFSMLNMFINIYLENDKVYELENIITQLLDDNSIKFNFEYSSCIVESFVSTCLLKNNKKELINIVVNLIKNNKEKNKIFYDVIRNIILKNKDINDVLLIMHSVCNIRELTQEERRDFQIMICGMCISDYILKKHSGKIGEDYKKMDKFIEILNKVLNRESGNKIKKIEDLTLTEIKFLFDEQMKIKFNKTNIGINSDDLETGAFLQIFYSLSSNTDGINESSTVEQIFNNRNSKMNDFQYVELDGNISIESKQDFLKTFNLTKDDFEKKNGFKVFYVGLLGHAITIIIDTSVSYTKFLENNDNFKDIIIVDSSRLVEEGIKNNALVIPDGIRDFFKKIQIVNRDIQENNTCWINTACTCSSVLKNSSSFNKIVYTDNKNTKLTHQAQNNIINEVNTYYIYNINKVDKKENYNEVYNEDKYLIKSNIKKEQFCQNPMFVFENQKVGLKHYNAEYFRFKNDKKTAKYKKQLDNIGYEIFSYENNLKKYKQTEYDNKIAIYNKIYDEYKQHKQKYKNLENELDLIVDKKINYVPNFGTNNLISNFKCYTNSKHANDTILSFSVNKNDKNIYFKIILKNTDISNINDKFLENLNKKVNKDGFDKTFKDAEINIKTETTKKYINLTKIKSTNIIKNIFITNIKFKTKY